MIIKQFIREVEQVTVYEDLPDGANFSDKFQTFILAFCPDTDSWFATNLRYFFYEYPMEFSNEEAAIAYFKRNPDVFMNLEKEMGSYRPNFHDGGVYLENTKELITVVKKVEGGASDGMVV